MSDSSLTLKSLFCDDVEKQAAEAIDLDACVKSMEAGKKVPRAVMPALVASLNGALDEILKVELGDVFENSWGKVKAVREAMDATAGAAGASAVVPLADHKVTSRHRPSVELYVGPKQLCVLEFEIALTLQVKDVSVAVEGGRVTGVHTGVALGEASLSFASHALAKAKSKEFKLPGRLRFSPTEAKAA